MLGRPAAPWIAVECGASNGARLDRTLFGCVAQSDAATDLESVSADSSHCRPRAEARCSCRTAPSWPPPRRRGWLASRATARSGSTIEIVATEWRLVASAPPTIDEDVRQNRFRGDLYRRLAVSRIDLPSLRRSARRRSGAGDTSARGSGRRGRSAAAQLHARGAGAAVRAQLARESCRAAQA